MARILSVEDDGEFQQLMGLFLRRAGYDVHYAFSGQEGYEKALTLRPDLILLDMMLPVLTGPEVIKRLKERPETRDIPIIVMTAYHKNAEFLEKAIKPMGVLEYLRKPVDFDELRSLLCRVLASGPAAPQPQADTIRSGAVRLEPATRSVWVDDVLVASLSAKPFDLLSELARAGRPVSRKQLLARVWEGGGSESSLEKTIERLRRALGPEGARIRTTQDGYELAG
jgi:DNA-binding response OmpR family regulator